jgi:MATH domain/Ankyrin repeats (many copies)
MRWRLDLMGSSSSSATQQQQQQPPDDPSSSSSGDAISPMSHHPQQQAAAEDGVVVVESSSQSSARVTAARPLSSLLSTSTTSSSDGDQQQYSSVADEGDEDDEEDLALSNNALASAIMPEDKKRMANHINTAAAVAPAAAVATVDGKKKKVSLITPDALNDHHLDDDEGVDHAVEEDAAAAHILWKPQTIHSTCEFTHVISDYAQKRESGCKKAEYSTTTTDDHGNRWRLIIYVNGNGRASNHHLSLFLQVADAEELPFGWKKAVSYVLTLEHPAGGSQSYAKRNPDKTFKLCPKAIDWGWSQFITSDRIQQEGFVADDTLTVRASVTVKSSSVSIDEDDAELYLKCAVEEGDSEAVQLCLEQGASVNCKFKDDLYTPLHTACSSSGTGAGSMPVLNLLLEEGADGNACNKWKETPLLIASNNGHLSAVQALLKHGADPSLCSEAGWSALTFAAHKVC